MSPIEHLRAREYGGISYNWSRTKNKRILKKLTGNKTGCLALRDVILSCQRRFKCQQSKPLSVSKAMYDDGKLFLADKSSKKMMCHGLLLSGAKDLTKLPKSSHLYSLPIKPRWRDQDTWISEINDEIGRPSTNHHSLRPSIFILLGDNTLNRLDLKTAAILDQVHLGTKQKFVALSISYDSPLINIVVKSTKQPKFCQNGPDCPSGIYCNRNRISISLIAFSFPPLKFVAHFEIPAELFCPRMGLKDVHVQDDIMMVQFKSKHTLLFDVPELLNQNLSQSYKIGDLIIDGGVVGDAQLGFPVNAVIKKLPPPLFSIKCHDFDVSFSFFKPFMSLSSDRSDRFRVYNIENQKETSFLKLGADFDNDARFSSDETSRVMHFAQSLIVIKEFTNEFRAVNRFAFCAQDVDDLGTFNRSNKSPDELIKMNSGDDNFNPEAALVTYDLENELNLMAFLTYQIIMPDHEEFGDVQARIHLKAVTLFDSYNYKFVRNIPIDRKFVVGDTDGRDTSVTFDRDLILVMVKDGSVTRCLAFRLTEEDNLGDPKLSVVKKPKAKPKRPRPRSEEDDDEFEVAMYANRSRGQTEAANGVATRTRSRRQN